MLNRRENLLRVFRHERPERIPIAGHCDPYNQPSREGMPPELAEALKKVEWCDESTVTLSRYLGIDVMDFFSPPVKIVRRNVTVESVSEGDNTTNLWHTPRGDLREVVRVCRAGHVVSANWTEHLVKGPGDIDAFASIFEDEVIETDGDGIERIRRRRALIGDDGLLMLFLPGTPLGMMFRMYSGVETLAYLYADAPAALADLFRTMERSYLGQFELAAQSDADALVGMDDTSTTAISPAMFERFNLALTDRRSDAAHAAGKLYFHHSCGLIRDLLPLYRRTRMDAVHAYTPPPTGNTTVADRRLLGERITTIAGLGQIAGPMNDRAAVRESIRRMYLDAAPWDHFILGLAAYPDKTVEEMRFIVDCCREMQDEIDRSLR